MQESPNPESDDGRTRRSRTVRIEVEGVREAADALREAVRGRSRGRRLSRSLSDPVRLQIFELLTEGDRTVRDLASTIGLAPDRLYYHLNLLEEAGLIDIAELRPERVYSLRTVQQRSSAEDVSELIGAVLDATTSELRAVLQTASALREKAGRAQKLKAAVGRSSVELTEEEFGRLVEESTALLDRAVERSKAGPASSRRQFRVLLAVYETVGDHARDDK
ncbi:MAG: ArsR/SmtB family transcription factor [Acidimicrobiia bacterium]